MKQRDHYRHVWAPDTNLEFWMQHSIWCGCTTPALHHEFVMGGRPVNKVKRLCDLWDDD